MAAHDIPLPVPGTTGERVDTQTLSSSDGNTVNRQVICIADPTTFGNIAGVTAAGNLQVAVNAALPAGTNTIGKVNQDTVTGPTTLGALNAALTLTTAGYGSAAFQMFSNTSFVGTITFEATVDGTNWFQVYAFAANTGLALASVVNPALGATWRLNTGGYQQVRLRVSAYTSGSSQFYGVASDGEGLIALSDPLPPGANRIGSVNSEVDFGIAGVPTAPLFAVINTATAASNQIVAGVNGKSIRVLSLVLVAAGAVNITWQSGSSGTALSGAMPLVANAGYSLSEAHGLFATASGIGLFLLSSAAIQVSGHISYITV